MKNFVAYSAIPFDHESDDEHRGIITIDAPCPRQIDLPQQDALFQREADDLEEVLYHCLPGGVYDRLLGVMLRRKSSHFIVSHGEPRSA